MSGFERIDYSAAPVTWREIVTETKGGATVQMQATIRFKVQDGFNEDGTPRVVTRRKSKLFPKDKALDTSNKRARAVSAWKTELMSQQETAITLAEAKAEREAEERLLAEEEAKREAEEEAHRASPSYMLVGEYVFWYLDLVSRTIERSTLDTYRVSAKRIESAFPQTRMEDLTKHEVQLWVNRMVDEGLSPQTITKHFRLLSLVTKYAATEEHINRNVCEGVRLPKKESDSRPNALSKEAYVRLAITLSQMEPTEVIVGATIAMWTGLREGEVCALRWKNYDEAGCRLSVEQNIARASGGSYAKEPKTRKSKRLVPVTPQLAYTLERRRERMLAALDEADIKLDSAQFGELFIVGSINGSFCQPAYMSRGWHTLAQAMGLTGTEGEPLVFHDLRHALATLLLAIGVPKQTVSDILGHARLSTLDYYIGSDPTLKDDAARLLSDVAASYTGAKPFDVADLIIEEA